MAKATNISNFSIENLLAIPYKRRQRNIETSLNGRTSISSPQSSASSMTAEILSPSFNELVPEQKRTNNATQSNFRPICLEAEINPSQINEKEELHQQSCGICQDCCCNALNDRSEFPRRIPQCQNSRVTRDSIRLPYPEILSAATSLHKPHQVSYEDICKHCFYCWEGQNSTCEVNLKRGRENCDREVRAVHDPVNVRRAGENCDRELRAVHDPFGGSYHAEKCNDDARDTFRNGFCDIKDCNGWDQSQISSDNHTHNVEEKFDWMTNPRPFYKKGTFDVFDHFSKKLIMIEDGEKYWKHTKM